MVPTRMKTLSKRASDSSPSEREARERGKKGRLRRPTEAPWEKAS